MKKSYCLRIPEDLKLLAVMRAREMNISFSDFVTLAILARQDVIQIAEDNPDWDPVLTCWCCPEDYNYENCENCDYRVFKELING